jgi:hypothetical protein
MEAIRSSETSVNSRSTQRYIPEDDVVHSHCCESLKSYKVLQELSSRFNSNDDRTLWQALYFASWEFGSNKIKSWSRITSVSYLKSPITEWICFVVRFVGILVSCIRNVRSSTRRLLYAAPHDSERRVIAGVLLTQEDHIRSQPTIFFLLVSWHTFLPWRRPQYVPLRSHWTPTGLHGVTHQKIAFLKPRYNCVLEHAAVTSLYLWSDVRARDFNPLLYGTRQATVGFPVSRSTEREMGCTERSLTVSGFICLSYTAEQQIGLLNQISHKSHPMDLSSIHPNDIFLVTILILSAKYQIISYVTTLIKKR